MKCPNCYEGFKVKGANRKKIRGVWAHKGCPRDRERMKRHLYYNKLVREVREDTLRWSKIQLQPTY